MVKTCNFSCRSDNTAEVTDWRQTQIVSGNIILDTWIVIMWMYLFYLLTVIWIELELQTHQMKSYLQLSRLYPLMSNFVKLTGISLYSFSIQALHECQLCDFWLFISPAFIISEIIYDPWCNNNQMSDCFSTSVNFHLLSPLSNLKQFVI